MAKSRRALQGSEHLDFKTDTHAFLELGKYMGTDTSSQGRGRFTRNSPKLGTIETTFNLEHTCYGNCLVSLTHTHTHNS